MNRWMGVLLLTTFFVVSTVASAAATPVADCSPIDLRPKANWKMRDQKKMGWCYAHSAADYLQYYFQLTEQVSAADIALQYNTQRLWPKFVGIFTGGPTPETGFMRTAMWDAHQTGFCPESALPSEDWTKVRLQGTKKGERVQVEVLEAIREIVQLQDQVKMGLFQSVNELPFAYEFPAISHELFFKLLRESNQIKTFLSELRIQACAPYRKAYPSSLPHIAMSVNMGNPYPTIDAVLDRGLPVNVDYFYGVLNNQDQFKRTIPELHSTLLVGRRPHPSTGECTYLIKNSYGSDCEEYDPRHQCEGGYVWVSARAFKKALATFVYLKN